MTNETNELKLEKFISKIQTAEKNLEKMRLEMKAIEQAEFANVCKEIFVLVPRLKAIAWCQYSPYFNDGDECVFSVGTPNALSFIPENVEYEYELEDENGFILGEGECNEDSLSENEKNAIQQVLDFIERHETLMEDLYGNHVGVILTEDEVNISEYTHD